MAKLYWRLKVNGKWTWRPVTIDTEFDKRLAATWAVKDGVSNG